MRNYAAYVGVLIAMMVLPGCSADSPPPEQDGSATDTVSEEVATSRAADASVYPISELADRQFDWTTIASDDEGDGQRPDHGDGRDLAYFYDADADSVWFRFRLHDSIPPLPAISLALDVDLDQATGAGWYGSVTDYTLDRLVSAGPRERRGDGLFVGYNGTTDAEGVRTRQWINVAEGVVTLQLDRDEAAIVARIHRPDLTGTLDTVRILGSVGASARWNDDIGQPAILSLPPAITD